MSSIEYIRIFADADGCSHCRKEAIELKSIHYAPPAASLNTTALTKADSSVFLELPAGWHGDWHATPVRQWLILMSGCCEFEVGDGERFICKAGDVVLLEDTSGRGHQTWVLGEESVRISAIHSV